VGDKEMWIYHKSERGQTWEEGKAQILHGHYEIRNIGGK